jgi:hypothetical protein
LVPKVISNPSPVVCRFGMLVTPALLNNKSTVPLSATCFAEARIEARSARSSTKVSSSAPGRPARIDRAASSSLD